MAIEAIEEGTQTQLVQESREEKLTKLFNLEMEIQSLRIKKDRSNDEVNALKNTIKKMESGKVELLHLINSGQETVIQVAVSSETDELEEEDAPSDEELAEFMDDEGEPAGDEEAEETDEPQDDGAEPVDDEEGGLDSVASEGLLDEEEATE